MPRSAGIGDQMFGDQLETPEPLGVIVNVAGHHDLVGPDVRDKRCTSRATVSGDPEVEQESTSSSIMRSAGIRVSA